MMFYPHNRSRYRRLVAFLMVLLMMVMPFLSYGMFGGGERPTDRLVTAEVNVEATPSQASPATAESNRAIANAEEYQRVLPRLDAVIPGMEIFDQAAAEPIVVERNEGELILNQSSITGGYNSSAGSQDTASLILSEDYVNGDFTFTATVAISEFARAGTGYGLYVGAFSGTASTDEFASLGFRGNSRIRPYGSKVGATFGAFGSDLMMVLDQQYQVTFTRMDGTYQIGVNSGDEVILAPTSYAFNNDGELAENAGVYPGFSLLGVSAVISDLTLISEGQVLIDSADWTGTYQPDRTDWGDVSAPVLGTPILASAPNAIAVPWTMEIGQDGADMITCSMKNEEGEIVDFQTVTQTASNGSFIFTPTTSGSYQFSAIAKRNSEEQLKYSTIQSYADFRLELLAPSVRALTAGVGQMKVIWSNVNEAEGYQISYRAEGTTNLLPLTIEPQYQSDENEYYLLVPGLTVGTNYYFEVVATAGGRESSPAGSCFALLRQSEERDWQFAWFGTSTNEANNRFSGNIYDGLMLESSNGRGKFTGDGYDGMAFYYTKIDPRTENFVLAGTFTVTGLTISNGQEGFALMVRDSLGVHGDSSGAYYTNSVATMASKVSYKNHDDEDVTLRLGVGSRVVKGIYDTMAAPGPGSFSSSMTTLDTRIQRAGESHLVEVDESYRFILKKTNTGYHMIYQRPDGTSTEEIFYEAEELNRIDEQFIYAGFAAARNCQVSVSDISFTTSDPQTDPPAQERPVTLVEPVYQIVSPKTSGSAAYTLVYSGNADGVLTISDQQGTNLVSDLFVTAYEPITKELDLTKGLNRFTVSMTPDPNYRPSEFEQLASYQPASFTTVVDYNSYGRSGQTIVVSATGSPQGTGSNQKPLDLKTAINYVQPGQTILMKGGTYHINDNLKIPRGINGTAEQMIYLIADPAAEERVVIDFDKIGTGFEVWGDFWYIRGIDICNSANMSKGLQLSGSHNTLDQINTYDNGNTGIQVSGLASDPVTLWPSDNLILNCTSFNNSDEGMEDADGFAAKLTCGTDNVFKGCIAYNNADDGWDLFAKVATGTIGAVTIEDCVTYRNGYLLDGTDAGNGNGFKMGGSALSGHHILKNGISFENKAKGIDSNSCPDIEVYQSTSFNNESYNVALYSNTGVSTGFSADGVLSFKTASGIGEQLRLSGQSSLSSNSNYFFDGSRSVNINGDRVSDQWFVSLDTTVAPTRLADGSIDMHGLLELTELVPDDTGARPNPTPSPEIDIPAVLQDSEDGSDKGNGTGTGSRGSSGSGSGSAVIARKYQGLISYPASSGDDGVWYHDEQGWYLINADNSYPKSEWKIIKGRWYFFNVMGYMVTGWQLLDGNQWYFLGADGAMATGWLLDKDQWYLLKTSGGMNIEPVIENDVTYYFNINGECVNP